MCKLGEELTRPLSPLRFKLPKRPIRLAPRDSGPGVRAVIVTAKHGHTQLDAALGYFRASNHGGNAEDGLFYCCRAPPALFEFVIDFARLPQHTVHAPTHL